MSQTLTNALFRLRPPGGLFDYAVLRNLFPDKSEGALKLLLKRACAKGEVMRLATGVYILSPEYRKSEPHPFAIAAMLHFPSHISFESALWYHGLIPEAVFQVSSATTFRSRTFRTPLGVFTFDRVPTITPLAGVETVKLDDLFWAFVATPLRAIADKLYQSQNVHWDTSGIKFLTESLRIERSDLTRISFAAFPDILGSFRSYRIQRYLNGLKKELIG